MGMGGWEEEIIGNECVRGINVQSGEHGHDVIWKMGGCWTEKKTLRVPKPSTNQERSVADSKQKAWNRIA